jgi:hypothetical protein
MANPSTVGEAAALLEKSLADLTTISNEISVHRAKFQLLLDKFHHFLLQFRLRPESSPLTQSQQLACSAIQPLIDQLYYLMEAHCEDRWTESTATTRSDCIPGELSTICKTLHERAQILDKSAADTFSLDAQTWVSPQLQDLRDIRHRFTQILRSTASDTPFRKDIEERLRSVDRFFEANGAPEENPGASPFTPVALSYRSTLLVPGDFSKTSPTEIGEGSFGIVYSGVLHKGSIPVAIKEVRREDVRPETVTMLRREATIMASLHHDTLVKCYGWTDVAPHCLVLELMKGSLHWALKYSLLTATQKTKIIYDIARGMRFLHSRLVVHRDLKSVNVLVDGEGNAKIADFGCARKIDNNSAMTMGVGTKAWMAPELQTGEFYTTKVDVFSYAIVVWEVLTGHPPSRQMTSPSQISPASSGN